MIIQKHRNREEDNPLNSEGSFPLKDIEDQEDLTIEELEPNVIQQKLAEVKQMYDEMSEEDRNTFWTLAFTNPIAAVGFLLKDLSEQETVSLVASMTWEQVLAQLVSTWKQTSIVLKLAPPELLSNVSKGYAALRKAYLEKYDIKPAN